MRARQGVVVLGSTGSVGVSTLDVLAAFPERFEVVGLAARSDATRLQEQIDRFSPPYAALSATNGATVSGTVVIDNADPLLELATLEDADIVVIATTGHAAIPATLAALQAGKIVALANKETIVAAGAIVMPVARSAPGQLRPVDSEHAAIWQCLPGSLQVQRDVRKILLTASGGPFRGSTAEELRAVTVEQALDHPNWEMGARITIDSATLMNKGFEWIEAAWLFDCPIDLVQIVIHPQSIVHSMVEYDDGSIIAQLASHDMRLPIQYALTYPERPAGPARRLSLDDFAQLTFEAPDFNTFRAPKLARRAFELGGAYPAILSTADEYAVNAFIHRRIPFSEIMDLVEIALDAHVAGTDALTLDHIAEADRWTTALLDQRLRERGT